MDCNEIRGLLPAHADGELDVRESEALEQHLAGCAACRAQYDAQSSLRRAVAGRATYHRAPAALEARIRAALPASRPARVAPPARRWWNWQGLGLAMASILAVVWSLDLYFTLPGADERLADEVVSSHVRSLLASHAVDVASSDQHTVKPWFSGKLDFSPPVRDFAGDGFPLIGGRLDYLQHRPVAALVYRRAQHVINVFVMPAAGAATPSTPRAASEDGFHTLHWRQGDLRFWAVSDVDPADLLKLSGLLRETGEAK